MIHTPPAWDFQDGRLRIWSKGEIVAVFEKQAKLPMALDVVAQTQKELRERDDKR